MQLPFALSWEIEPESWQADDEGTVTVKTGAGTDYFVDPAGGHEVTNAPRALAAPPQGPWQLTARVAVGFRGTYDAGVLMIFADERHWAKLCFERSPQGSAMVVSVVTNGISDDANAWVVEQEQIWLRISSFRGAYAFHASTDGDKWEFVRYFGLGATEIRVGIEAQAPIGDGCEVTFSNLSLMPSELADLRDGS